MFSQMMNGLSTWTMNIYTKKKWVARLTQNMWSIKNNEKVNNHSMKRSDIYRDMVLKTLLNQSNVQRMINVENEEMQQKISCCMTAWHQS